MMAMVAAMATPAFATGKAVFYQCTPSGPGEIQYAFDKQQAKQFERQGYNCVKAS
jgi:hypothetical protein